MARDSFLPHLLICTAGRSLGAASARTFSTVSVHRAIARAIENRGCDVRYPVHLYHNTVQRASTSHAGIVSGDNEKVPIHCRHFFTVRLGLRVSNYRHPLTPCAARRS